MANVKSPGVIAANVVADVVSYSLATTSANLSVPVLDQPNPILTGFESPQFLPPSLGYLADSTTRTGSCQSYGINDAVVQE
ncbi:MAG: hypothetical protein M1352_01590 [Patescibacteria group bacterium]|nr:hypothetical protein [Patescibacteria group bacterium]